MQASLGFLQKVLQVAGCYVTTARRVLVSVTAGAQPICMQVCKALRRCSFWEDSALPSPVLYFPESSKWENLRCLEVGHLFGCLFAGPYALCCMLCVDFDLMFFFCLVCFIFCSFFNSLLAEQLTLEVIKINTCYGSLFLPRVEFFQLSWEGN